MKIDLDNMESFEGLAAARRKSARETGTKEVAVSVKKDAKESKEDQLGSGVAECVERTLERPVFTLGIIDDVFPTAEWHMGTLARVLWSTSKKQLPTIEEEDTL